MSRLPRQDIPVSLQRFQPGHIPNRRARTTVGRSNRLAHIGETHDAMERVFVPHACSGGSDRHSASANVSVSQAYTLSGYRSARGQTADVHMVRTLVDTLRAGETANAPVSAFSASLTAHKKGATTRRAAHHGFQPPLSQPPSPPEAHLETEQARLEADMHPTVAGLVCAQRYGTGHTITAENLFLRRGGQDADYYTTLPASAAPGRQKFSTFQAMPFIRNRHVPARCEGGGTLEYADPITDEYARNRGVASFDNRQLRAAAEADAIATALTTTSSPRDCVGRVTCDDVHDVQTVPTQTTPSPVVCPPVSSSSSSLPPHDAWLSTYVPSARPYEVQPFLGRCGYSDFRSTHHRIQPQPDSDMYAPSRQYQSTYTVPLETPNLWQARNAKCAQKGRLS